MHCRSCHRENSPDSNFCQACGDRLAVTCASCGSELPGDSRFCNKCGHPVARPAGLGAGVRPPAARIPKHLAEKILGSRARLEGERKQVTVLFADVQGSTELVADRDPEEARDILDPVLELMMAAVHQYEGTVNQVLGDGIMALFGAPLAHEDHAVRACYAALAMQSAVRRHNEQRAPEAGSVHIRVGLNSGEVVVRTIGTDLDMDYSAVGQVTHLASRMEQAASPDTVLLTADTFRLAEGFVQARNRGARFVRGLGQPVEVFELTGAAPARTRWQATVARGLGRFVGRENEMRVIELGLENARAGRGQVIALVGEPGVGKSRLLWEFTHSIRTAGWLVLEGDAAPYAMDTPYVSVTGLLKAYFQVEPSDDGRKVHEKVIGKLLAFAPDMQPAVPALLALLDVDVDDAEWQGLDPPERRQRILAAVAAVLVRESRVQPVCLVFEDLHWSDSETQAVLDRVVSALAGERLLLLVSYRPGYEHAWRHARGYTELGLQRLPEARSEELLRALLGDAASLQPLTRLLIDRTDGNPLFLEESVRTLVEMGTLVGEPGAYRPTRPIEAIQVPPTVQVVVAARVDRLAPQEKSLLQIAAVIGRDVPYAVAREIAELPEDDLRRSFARLQAAGFLYEAKIFPALEYTFKHSLTHEVAYQSLLQDRRRALHARIVEALERLHASHLGDQLDHLAHHATRGELWDKALAYCRQAGAKAFARSVSRTAVTRFEEALRALEHLPQSRQALEQAIDLRLELRYSLTPLGEFARVLEELRTAERLARQLGDERRLGVVCAFLSNHYTVMGDLARGADYGERVLGIADRLGDVSLRVLANSALSMVNYRIGRYAPAIELARRNIDTLQGELLGERFGMAPIASVYARTLLVWSLCETGELDEAIAAGEEAVRIAEAAEHAHSICFACHGLGLACLRRGDLQRAVAVLERARALCETADVPLLFPVIAGPLGSALAAAGRTDESIALLELGVERAMALRHPFGHWLRTGALCEALLHAGRAVEALPLARQAVQTTRYVRLRGGEAWALALLADAASQQREPDAANAERYYRDALAIATELGMRPLVAQCHAGLARLHRRLGDPKAAQTSLAVATDLFRAMRMTYWLEKAEAQATAIEQG